MIFSKTFDTIDKTFYCLVAPLHCKGFFGLEYIVAEFRPATLCYGSDTVAKMFHIFFKGIRAKPRETDDGDGDDNGDDKFYKLSKSQR